MAPADGARAGGRRPRRHPAAGAALAALQLLLCLSARAARASIVGSAADAGMSLMPADAEAMLAATNLYESDAPAGPQAPPDQRPSLRQLLGHAREAYAAAGFRLVFAHDDPATHRTDAEDGPGGAGEAAAAAAMARAHAAAGAGEERPRGLSPQSIDDLQLGMVPAEGAAAAPLPDSAQQEEARRSLPRRSLLLSQPAGQALQAAAPLPLLGSAGGRGARRLWGLTYSWRRAEACDGAAQLCRCPRPDDGAVARDLELLSSYSSRLRTYSVECPDLMRMLFRWASADGTHSSWLLGIWVGEDAAATQAQVEMLGRLLREHPGARLAGVVVGNEAVSRGDVTEAQLLGLAAQVRALVRTVAREAGSEALARVPVLTVELPAAITGGLVAGMDAVGVNLQPFYSLQLDTQEEGWADAAVAAVVRQHAQLQAAAQGRQVVVTEVGWPSHAGELDTNRSSGRAAAAFLSAWREAAERLDVPYFYHELADAAWKGALRRGAAEAAAAARRPSGPPAQLGVLARGELGDEHFGLLDDRRADKGVLPVCC